jgi:hypothetical protein
VWQLGDAARAASEAVPSSQLPYNGAGPWVTPCVPLRTIPAHMLQLIAMMRRFHPWIRSVSPIRPCERRADGTLSMHSTGRAADVMVPTISGPEGLALANWLVQHAKELGVQYVIWDRMAWQGNRPVGSRFQPYRARETLGPSLAHTNHVHVELTEAPGPWLAPPTAPIAPQTMAFIRALIAPTLPGQAPLITTRSRSTSSAWWVGGAIVGAGAGAASAKHGGAIAGALVGAVVGLMLSPTDGSSSSSTSTPATRPMRY